MACFHATSAPAQRGSRLFQVFLKKYREHIGETIAFYGIRVAAVVMLVSGAYLLTQAGN
jgi:hypothetical protein